MGGEGQIESQRGGGRHVFCPEDKKHGRKANFAATWWRRVDSNHRSETQQIYSLPPLATRELLHMKLWSWWTDSNPRPADYKSAALPAELHQRVSLTLEYYIIFEKICQGKSGKYFIIPLFPISAIFPAFPQHDYPAFFGTSQGHHRRFLWRDDDFGW